jgi:hypothetical protein
VKVHAVLLAAALGSLIPLTAAFAKAPAKLGAKSWSWTFEADTLGRPPIHTGVFGGDWKVAEDSTQAGTDTLSLTRVLRQTETDDGIEFHYVQFTKPVLGDLTASVRFRIRSGEIDPTAGIMFQLDPKGRSGYLVRVSGQKEALIAHYLLYGKRRDLKLSKIDPPAPGTWHRLGIERKGSVLTVLYDGEEQFRVRDERFRKGSVGLWTEDDTVVDFADLRVSTN